MISDEVRHELRELKTDLEILNMGAILESKDLARSSIDLMITRLNSLRNEVA
jgi:hypothetical protein